MISQFHATKAPHQNSDTTKTLLFLDPGAIVRFIKFHHSVYLLILGLAVGCNQSNFANGGYKKGENRDNGSNGKDQVLQNSAFGNGTETENTTNKIEPRLPAGPTTSLKVIGLCSNAWTQAAGTNARRASGIVASIVPVTPGQSDLRGPMTVTARSGNVVHLDDSTTATRLHQEITGNAQFNLSLADIPDGDYQLTLCDASMQQACKQNPPPSTKSDRFLFVGTPGQVGTAIMNIQQGQLTKIQSIGTRDKAMVVLIDGNSGVNGPGCDQSASPLIIDLANIGIDLSSPAKGVSFDIDADGAKDSISWPLAASSVFLALDLNGNDLIDNGSELFGNNSTGPDGKKSDNGFLALAKYDDNHDGFIDSKDGCFKKLLLWSDKDRNGLTTPDELSPLASSDIASIDLSYKDGFELDQYGNSTRQRSVVKLKDGKLRLIVDIWFQKTSN